MARNTRTAAPPAKAKSGANMIRAAARFKEGADSKPYRYPIKAPDLPPGVVPANIKAPVMAMDYAGAGGFNPYTWGGINSYFIGFPGYPYLSQLATRAEYRAFASTLSTELTREWIEFTSKQDDDTDSKEKIKLIEAEFKRLKIRETFQTAAEQDSYFGRAQFYLDLKDHDPKVPLILSPATIARGSLNAVRAIEAIWTTPSAYNALNPARADFYVPTTWFVMGQETHASRLLTVITRPVPDILKPAFNFGGMSLSQLAEPYVDNWLRTRQSVADLINNFSITVLRTAMDEVLQGNNDGADLFKRADLFTATRSNKGLMLLDKDREELQNISTPLSGLHELQAQSQEHMCSVSRMPAIVLTGISPSGLNASSDGEIRVFYDWISAQQNAYWLDPLNTILQVVQLSMFGEIDPDIEINYIPLYQMTPKELAEIRKSDSEADGAYIDKGVVSPIEVRERLARDPTSGYSGLDTGIVPAPPAPDPEEAPGDEPPDGLNKEDAAPPSKTDAAAQNVAQAGE